MALALEIPYRQTAEVPNVFRGRWDGREKLETWLVDKYGELVFFCRGNEGSLHRCFHQIGLSPPPPPPPFPLPRLPLPLPPLPPPSLPLSLPPPSLSAPSPPFPLSFPSWVIFTPARLALLRWEWGVGMGRREGGRESGCEASLASSEVFQICY